METIISSIIGGIFAIIVALIGRHRSSYSETKQPTSQTKYEVETQVSSSSTVGKVLYFLIGISPVIIPLAYVILFQEPGEYAAGGRYRYGEVLPIISIIMLSILVIAMLGLLKTTARIFYFLFGRLFTPIGLFRAGLMGLLLSLLMDEFFQETILRIIYGGR